MAALIYNFSKIQKRFNAYEKTQANFAGKVALTKLGKELKGKDGLIARSYKGGHGLEKFKEKPVFFTLNSTFTKQQGLVLDVGVKDEKALKGKGNPASKYLYPVIGGGSTQAYDTLFTQYLRNRNLINKGDYPYAVTANRFIRLGRNGRVTKSTYSNTMIGLAKTRDKEVKARSRNNGKIQDARVIAFKTKTAAGKYKKGIYREHTPSSGKYRSYLKPLFIFKEIPTQKGKFTFRQRVKFFADKKVFKYWSREIKRLAKE
ncbi:MAG: hypothetical protein CM15mV93_210 [Caudoviricetes sp.]|nr:MAG: hypothetical protein CM15mV93_210 [Caudoviricetes sp.]